MIVLVMFCESVQCNIAVELELHEKLGKGFKH